MFESLRQFFNTGATFDVAFRRKQLESLLLLLKNEEKSLANALHEDLGKSPQEAWLTEIGFVKHELEHVLHHLKDWTGAQKVPTPLFLQPGASRIQPQPRGVVMIISPWNYPIQLMISPLIAAIAAGNTAVIKPSEYAPHTAQWAQTYLPQALDSRLIRVVQGDAQETSQYLKYKFDLIFFTGSEQTAKHIARAAAEQLTPTVLELGGKSPCTVLQCKKIDIAARRIAFAKFINAGQTCVAPDYIIVREDQKAALEQSLKKSIVEMFGEENRPKHMAHIVNEKHFRRLENLLHHGEKLIFGGKGDAQSLLFAPTLIEIEKNHPIMSEEIFGPILPIVTIDNESSAQAALSLIAEHPTPLAAYLFGGSKDDVEAFRRLRCGGFVHNDALMHLSNVHLPFGGVGSSGYGQSHGYAGFCAFSHMRSELFMPESIDFALRYPPYTEKQMRMLQKLF